jgi:hypothetical protein
LGQHLGFEETVSNAWKIPVKSNNPTIILNTKLKNVRTALKEWNKYLLKNVKWCLLKLMN